MKLIYQKLIISGNLIRIIEYEKPIKIHYSKPPSIENTEKKENDPAKTQKKCDRRAAHKIERIINSYFFLYPNKAFFTLTYHKKQENRGETRQHLNYLFRSLNNENRKTAISWLAITELQERGALHVHGIMNAFVPFDAFLKRWQIASGDTGGCWLEKCIDNTNLGTYITKYLFKSPEKQGRKKGERRYWKSKDVRDISISFEFEKIHDWSKLIDEMSRPYLFEYDTDFNGKAKGFSGCYHNPGEVAGIAYALSTEFY